MAQIKSSDNFGFGKTMSAEIVSTLMEKALHTNAERDKIDREAGFLPASEGDLMLKLRTVQLAIDCGLKTGDPDCVAEAGAMLTLITGYYPWRY